MRSVRSIECKIVDKKVVVITIGDSCEIYGTGTLDVSDECAYLCCFFVRKEYRRKMLGTMIFKEALRLAAIHKKRSVYLVVKKSNKSGIAFWEKMGFRFQSDDKDSFWMALPLK